MYGEPDPPQRWSVHAEFTISHPGADDIENPPKTNTAQDENGTRLSYSWISKENTNIWSHVPQRNASSKSTSNRSVYSDVARPRVYQRGNLVFSSTPPSKFSEAITGVSRLGVQDSGYGSDLLSPNSLAGSGLPIKPYFPYNRRCKSTCNIVLSTSSQDKAVPEEFFKPCHVHCGRTQSLRCQTPSVRCRANDYNFYGCGDPWCYHTHIGDNTTCLDKTSPVLETCNDPHLNTSTTSDFHPPVVALEKKDASVQTFELIDKCTSPLVKKENFVKNPITGNIEKNNRKNVRGSRQQKAQLKSSQTPSFFTPDSLDSLQPSKKISGSPNLKILPTLEQQGGKNSARESSDLLIKPHTVHIDVYCTGTDMESDDTKSSDSSQNETASTPQTVYELNNVCVTHGRSENNKLPFHLREGINAIKNSKNALIENYNSDIDDEASTDYPSKISSYSTINDFSSSISSVPKSWTTYSLSSCAVPDDYDSVGNTSCKDTFSDFDSLLHSSSSIAQIESIDFIPMKLYTKNLSIDETPEIDDKCCEKSLNNADLHPSDSFEYANPEAKLHIAEMERMLKSKSRTKQQKHPQSQKNILIQQKMQEYIKSRIKQHSKSKDSDSDFSDDSEKGWTFIKHQRGTHHQDLKYDRSSKEHKERINNMEHLEKERLNSQIVSTSAQSKEQPIKQGGFPNSTQSTSKSPPTDLLSQKLISDHTLRSPFSLLPGKYTKQRHIASRFGPIVNTFKKPGHHIGPTKNPDCFCDHCQRYFKDLEYRNITQSTL